MGEEVDGRRRGWEKNRMGEEVDGRRSRRLGLFRLGVGLAKGLGRIGVWRE